MIDDRAELAAKAALPEAEFLKIAPTTHVADALIIRQTAIERIARALRAHGGSGREVVISDAFHIAELESVIVTLRQQKEALTLRFERSEARVKDLETRIQRQTEHQVQSDLRIQNQKVEIHRRGTEYTGVAKRLENFERWKRETEQWADKGSAFWKIHELESHLSALLLAGEPFLKWITWIAGDGAYPPNHWAVSYVEKHAAADDLSMGKIRALAAALEKAREAKP